MIDVFMQRLRLEVRANELDHVVAACMNDALGIKDGTTRPYSVSEQVELLNQVAIALATEANLIREFLDGKFDVKENGNLES